MEKPRDDRTAEPGSRQDTWISEAALKAVLESSGTGILVVDSRGGVMMTNTLFQEMWRIPPEIMETSDDHALLEFVCGQLNEPQAFLRKVRELYGSAEMSHDHIYFKDGRVFERLSAPLIVEGEIRGRVWSFLDISERKRMEGEIRESLAFLQQLLDSIPNPVFYKNLEGRYTGCNRAFEDYLGIPRERILGSTVYDVAPRELADRYAKMDAELLSEPGVQIYEARVRYADGTLRDVIFNKAVFRDREGKVAGIVGVMQDITERRRIEQALERANRELDAYAAAVSHDLRNPIAVTASAVGTLEAILQRCHEPGTEEKVREVVEIVKSSSAAAETLVEGLLALARAGQKPQKVELVEVGEILGRVLTERREEIRRRRFRLSLDEDLGRLYADPVHIYQLFSNLIGNSLRYNEGPTPEIWVEYLGEHDGEHAYRIRDNGPGIPEDLLPRLFEPFSKGSRGDTGIGLAIAKKVVEAYSGEIEAFNDAGAVFRFTLRDAVPQLDR